MPTSEPTATAILLTICGILLLVSVLSSRASQRIGVPSALFFLVVGMLAGSEGFGGIPFADYRLAFALAKKEDRVRRMRYYGSWVEAHRIATRLEGRGRA